MPVTTDRLKGFMIDIQGTLIDDMSGMPLPGARAALNRLKEFRWPYCLVTNNTKVPSERFVARLEAVGLPVDRDAYIDPLMVLGETLPPCRVAAYGADALLELLSSRGYVLDYAQPEAVLIGIRSDYGSEDFAQMIGLLLCGARLIGLHATSTLVRGDRRYPGIGAILAMLEYATGVSPLVVGKPSRDFYAAALGKMRRCLNAPKELREVMIVSDDAKGDLLGAKMLGMHTALVLSGKIRHRNEIESTLKESLDWIGEDIDTWCKTLERSEPWS